MHACLLRSDSRLSIHYVHIDRLGYATFRVCRNIGLIRFGKNTTMVYVYVASMFAVTMGHGHPISSVCHSLEGIQARFPPI